MNSSMDNEPDPSRSSFLNLFPSLLISSESNAAQFIGKEASLPILFTSVYFYLQQIFHKNEWSEMHEWLIMETVTDNTLSFIQIQSNS